MVEKEMWKPIKGYEGLYKVSNLGNIYSVYSKRNKSLCKSKRGYFRVQLWKDNVGTHHFVHRLVATAFVDNPLGKPQINHIDEDKTNNKADNLEWCTQHENHNCGTINQRISKSLTNNPKKSKPCALLDDIGNVEKVFPSVYEASRQTGINVSSIRDVLHGRNKHAGGRLWQFI